MTFPRTAQIFEAVILATALTFASGCTKWPGSSASQPSDSQLMSDVSNKLAADQALSGEQIQAQVASGVAVLSGTVDNDAAKGLAAADAQQVNGIKNVVNNLTVVPRNAAAAAVPPPAAAPSQDQGSSNARSRSERTRAERTRAERRHRDRSNPVQISSLDQQPQQPQQQPDSTPVPQTYTPPPPPPAPVSRTFTLPTGTIVPVRLIDSLQTGVTQSNTPFRASLAADLVQDGMVVVRQGASVTGRVIEAKDATHYTGNSALTLELSRINASGQAYSLVTDPYTQEGKGRGKNTAEKAGGGAVLGAIIGAIAGGGKGAAIGSVAGGGIGAGANTVTRGQQVSLPAETIVRFRLSAPLQVTTTSRGEQIYDNAQPTLQPKQY